MLLIFFSLKYLEVIYVLEIILVWARHRNAFRNTMFALFEEYKSDKSV